MSKRIPCVPYACIHSTHTFIHTDTHTESVRLRPCWPEENLVIFQHDLGNPALTLNGKPTSAAVNAEAASSKGQRKLKWVAFSFCLEAAPLSISQQTSSQRAPLGPSVISLATVGIAKQACHIWGFELFHPGPLLSIEHVRGWTRTATWPPGQQPGSQGWETHSGPSPGPQRQNLRLLLGAKPVSFIKSKYCSASFYVGTKKLEPCPPPPKYCFSLVLGTCSQLCGILPLKYSGFFLCPCKQPAGLLVS